MRRATPADKPAIFSFIKTAYQGRWQFKIPERWRWEFEANPALEAGELPVWIAVDAQNRVVGQSCALVERLRLGPNTVRVGWGVDAWVDPAYRGRGLGARLQKANCQTHDVFMSLSMAQTVRKMKADLGAVALEPVATYLRPYPLSRAGAVSALLSHVVDRQSSIASSFARLLRLSQVDRAAAGLYNARRRSLDARLLAAAGRDIVVDRVGAFDREADNLWESVSTHFDAIVKRDSTHLNWKYVDQPHIAYERFTARRSGQLCGYVVVRKATPPEPRIGIVTDLLVAPDDEAAIMALLARAQRFFDTSGVEAVVAATNQGAYQEVLARFGFVRIREDAPMAGSHVRRDLMPLIETGRWFLGKGDHDWDQYPLAAV